MTDDQFNKLFKYMQGEFAGMRTEIKAVRDDVQRVYNLVDADVGHEDTDRQERTAMSAQLDRHEGWIGQIAKDTGTKLVPEP